MIKIRKFVFRAKYLFWRIKRKCIKAPIDNVAYRLLTHAKQEPRFVNELLNFKKEQENRDDSVDSLRLSASAAMRHFGEMGTELK